MTNRKPPPSKYEIASFWSLRVSNAPHAFLVDLGDPCCFACRYFAREWDRPATEAGRWQAATLERAHIVASSAGGSDEPSNFVLLCKGCHADAPMTSDPAIMYAWCDRREGWMFARVRKVMDDLRSRGISEEDAATVSKVELDDALRSLDVGLHMGDHGPQIPAASFAEAYAVALRKKAIAT